MRAGLLCLLLAAAASPATLECPVEEIVAYSRDTTPGIPPGPGVATAAPVSTTYFIYLIVGKQQGTVPAVSGVWLKGKYLAATLRKVTPPVQVDQDVAVPTAGRETLVPATTSDVYQLQPGGEQPWRPRNDDERALTNRYPLVVFIESGQGTRCCPVAAVKRLRPTAGM